MLFVFFKNERESFFSDNSERKMLVPSNSPIKNPTKEVIAPAHNLFPFLCVINMKDC